MATIATGCIVRILNMKGAMPNPESDTLLNGDGRKKKMHINTLYIPFYKETSRQYGSAET